MRTKSFTPVCIEIKSSTVGTSTIHKIDQPSDEDNSNSGNHGYNMGVSNHYYYSANNQRT